MRSSFVYNGIWFLPSNSDDQVSGKLTFDPEDEISLELYGQLREYDNNFGVVDIILGQTTDSKLITLYRCLETRRGATNKWLVIFAIVGGHFSTKDDLKFSFIASKLAGLNEWLNVRVFRSYDVDQSQGKIKLEYKQPARICFEVDNKVDACFGFVYKVNSTSYKIDIEHNAEFVIEVKKEEISLDELVAYVHNFQKLLTIGVYEASFPLSVRLRSKRKKQDVFGKEYLVDFSLFYKVSMSASSIRPKISKLLLFNYSDIKPRFKIIIKKWYMLVNEIEPVINLLLDTFYHSGSFNESKFLNLTQALETFHRRRRKNTVLPEKQYKLRMKAINDAIPEKYKKFVGDRLINSNEPSLHYRLESLLKEFDSPTLSRIVLDKNKFIQQTKDSRNYYTHYDKKKEKKALKQGELFYLTEELKVILISAILKETGFSYKKIIELLGRSEQRFFNHIIKQKDNGKV